MNSWTCCTSSSWRRSWRGCVVHSSKKPISHHTPHPPLSPFAERWRRPFSHRMPRRRLDDAGSHARSVTALLATNATNVHGWPKLKARSDDLIMPAGKNSTLVRPGQGATSACLPQHDYLRYVRLRQTRWLNSSYVLSNNIWQRAIDDKILGYIFARSVGVPIAFCALLR